MAKVFVSSTFLDLKECRQQVSLVLRKMGHEDVAMEYYVAEDKRPVDKCLADVATCDLYVGIFAWPYPASSVFSSLRHCRLLRRPSKAVPTPGPRCSDTAGERGVPTTPAPLRLRRAKRAGKSTAIGAAKRIVGETPARERNPRRGFS